jgi:hypothetical protein
MNPEQHQTWMAFRGAVLGIPIMLRAALVRPEDRADAIRVARVVRQLHVDAIAEFGELDAQDLVGSTLKYVRDRIVDVYGEAAWEEAAEP